MKITTAVVKLSASLRRLSVDKQINKKQKKEKTITMNTTLTEEIKLVPTRPMCMLPLIISCHRERTTTSKISRTSINQFLDSLFTRAISNIIDRTTVYLSLN